MDFFGRKDELKLLELNKLMNPIDCKILSVIPSRTFRHESFVILPRVFVYP